jgi:hypothetical protein
MFMQISSHSTQSSDNQMVFQRRNRLKHHFVNTSKVLLYGYKNLSDSAKITYQVIDGYDWEDKETGDSKGYVYPAVETLAAIRGLSKRTIERHITELENVKLLTRQQRRNLPSILVIEDVSEEEGAVYQRQIFKGNQVAIRSSPALRRSNVTSAKEVHTATSHPLETTKMTNDKNDVSDEGRGTTKMTFAYMDEKRRSEEQQQQVVADLAGFKIGKRKAQQLVVRYSLTHIAQKIQLLKWKLGSKAHGQPILDTAAWLVRAIEEDYPLPATLTQQQQKPRKKVIGVNEQEGVYTVLEDPSDVVVDS